MKICQHLRITVLLLIGGGCAGTPRPFEAVAVPIELAAARCCEKGPSVQILRVQKSRCGKGDTCTILDQRIKNPEDRPLWLLVDAGLEFSAYLDSVSILHNRFESSPPVWEFSGQNYHQALRLPPHADIIVHNLEYFGDLKEFRAVFFDRVALNYDRHLELSREGFMPAHGNFDMGWLGLSQYDGKKLYPLEGKERVSLGMWCEQTVPVLE